MGFYIFDCFLKYFFSRVLPLNVPGLLFLYVNGKPYKNNKHYITEGMRVGANLFNIKQAGPGNV